MIQELKHWFKLSNWCFSFMTKQEIRMFLTFFRDFKKIKQKKQMIRRILITRTIASRSPEGVECHKIHQIPINGRL